MERIVCVFHIPARRSDEQQSLQPATTRSVDERSPSKRHLGLFSDTKFPTLTVLSPRKHKADGEQLQGNDKRNRMCHPKARVRESRTELRD